MANKPLFSSMSSRLSRANAVNEAGGLAYLATRPSTRHSTQVAAPRVALAAFTTPTLRASSTSCAR